MMLLPNATVTNVETASYERPHNIEAEQALLGALLTNNDIVDVVSDVVSSKDFYEPIHAEIWRIATVQIGSGRRVTAITLADHFAQAPDVAPGLTVRAYIGRLMTAAVGTISAKDYAQTIRNLSLRRAVMTIAEEMIIGARDIGIDVSPMVLVEEAEQALFEVAEISTARKSVSIGEALDKALKDAEEAFKSGTGLRGLSTGLIDLDAILGGLAPGGLYILAGRPSMGKTALATNIAWSVAKSGKRVDFFSMEMGADEIALRIAASETRASSSSIRLGLNDGKDLVSANREKQRIGGFPLGVDASGGSTVAQIASSARRYKRLHGTQLIVIDYLQLMVGGSRHQNRVQELTEITVGLKALAKELNVPIIALSQLSRGVESREDKRPMLSDLRESGSIEQDADVVMFVFREEYYLSRRQPKESDLAGIVDWEKQMRAVEGIGEVIVAKNRHGSIGTAKLQFDARLTLFSNLSRGAS